MRAIIVVPARLESTRLPRKLLLAETGKPLIVETLESLHPCVDSRLIDGVMVVTDSDEIEAVCDAAWFSVLRSAEASCGTDRIASVVDKLTTFDLIVNVQADEPDTHLDHVAAVIDAARQFPACDMATLATMLRPEDRGNREVVKVAVDRHDIAVGFGRHSETVFVDQPSARLDRRHIGVYAYTPAFLKWFASLRPTPNEQRQNLEQLRALDRGCRIRVAHINHSHHSIDTRAQYDEFVRRRGH